MTDSNFTLTILIAVIILGAVYVDPVSSIRVQRFACDGSVEKGRCKGKLVKAGRVKFTANRNSNSVAMLVLDNQGSFAIHGVFYPNCAVVDGGNWRCNLSEQGSHISMLDGYYSSVFPGSSIQTVGVSGIRYWISWAGMNINPTWPDVY